MNLVSIIIPSYNAAMFLPETIQSVISQTYSEWELIIVDDGSNDNTKEIVESFKNDQRIKYFFQKNQGVAAARNYGIIHSNGKYIAFLDADDAWVKNNLELKLEAIKKNNCDFVFSKMYLCDENLKIQLESNPGTDENMLNELLLWNRDVIPCPSGNLLIKKKCFENGLSFDINLSTAADQDFTIYLCKDFKGFYLDVPLMLYRVLPGSMSKNIKVMEKDHIMVYNKARKKQLFYSNFFLLQCYSNLFQILAGSYWKDAGMKMKGLYFLFKSFVFFPPNFFRFINKKIF